MTGFQKQEATNPLSQLLKLTFIKVVTGSQTLLSLLSSRHDKFNICCSKEHEGYLLLMIPKTETSVFELNDAFKKEHYLTYLLLNEVCLQLQPRFSQLTNANLRYKDVLH